MLTTAARIINYNSNKPVDLQFSFCTKKIDRGSLFRYDAIDVVPSHLGVVVSGEDFWSHVK